MGVINSDGDVFAGVSLRNVPVSLLGTGRSSSTVAKK